VKQAQLTAPLRPHPQIYFALCKDNEMDEHRFLIDMAGQYPTEVAQDTMDYLGISVLENNESRINNRFNAGEFS
jgi:hypothetical protein